MGEERIIMGVDLGTKEGDEVAVTACYVDGSGNRRIAEVMSHTIESLRSFYSRLNPGCRQEELELRTPYIEAVFREYLPSTVLGSLERIQIAEEELTRFAVAHPEQATEINRSFMALLPTEVLLGKSPDVYRSHARELLERVVVKASLEPATWAECLCYLLDCATITPLNSDGQALADLLFRTVLGDRNIPGEPPRESVPGALMRRLDNIKTIAYTKGRGA